MRSDIAQGVAIELNFLLKPGWKLFEEPEHFRIVAPSALNRIETASIDLRHEVWRIAQFVAYSDYVSIQKTAEGGYRLISKTASGEGFEIAFDPI